MMMMKKKKKKKEKKKKEKKEVGDRGIPGDRVAPCTPKRHLREGASLAFRRDAEGWRRVSQSLGTPVIIMWLMQCNLHSLLSIFNLS